MFSFFTSEKSNTLLLNQSITPIVSYTALQDTMASLFKTKKLKCVPNVALDNSLTQSWDSNKQGDWNLYKNLSIKFALHHFNIEKHDILELYALLADCRNIIAVNLKQKDAENLGKSRKTVTEKEFDTYCTFLNYTGTYASFSPLLVEKYHQNWKDDNSQQIKIDDIEVSKITCIELDELALQITHCKSTAKAFDLLAKKIRDEFQVFLTCNDEQNILQSIAKIAYYFALAMPLYRGSAATTEMLIQVLLKGKGLNFEYKDDINMPLDLHAFFSSSIDEFVETFRSRHIKTNKMIKNRDLFFKETTDNNDDIISVIQSSFNEFEKDKCVIS